MTDRQYEDYSELQLKELRRDLQKNQAKVRRDRDAYTNQFKGSGSDWVWTSEDYVGFTQRIQAYDQSLREVDYEYRAREEIRRKRRLEREARENGRRTGGGVGLVTVACGCDPPRYIKLTPRAIQGGPVLCGVCNHPFLA